MKKLFFILAAFFMLNSLVFSYDKDTSIVNDTCNLLSDNEETELLQIINKLKNDYGSELAILIVNNTNGKSMEEYSLEYCNTNRIGSQKNHDGLLIVVSMHNRGVRIEVGYGLEKIISDDTAGNIIRSIIAPEFKNEKYGVGLIKAVQTIDNKIRLNTSLIGDIKGIKVN
jgi:uncharacterized protein